MTVLVALRELEKIMLFELPDSKYYLSYTVTRTQKNILTALDMSEQDVIYIAKKVANMLQEDNDGKRDD